MNYPTENNAGYGRSRVRVDWDDNNSGRYVPPKRKRKRWYEPRDVFF